MQRNPLINESRMILFLRGKGAAKHVVIIKLEAVRLSCNTAPLKLDPRCGTESLPPDRIGKNINYPELL